MDIIEVIYWKSAHRAFWSMKHGTHNEGTYCANRYATFHGDIVGEHQVHGPARSPLSAKRIRDWFRKEYCYGGDAKITVRRVKDIGDLPHARR